MIILSGASASGKTEIAKILAKKYGMNKVITTTTRQKRPNEINGIDYFFVNEEKFLQMIKDERFVEHIFYNNKHYGSTKDQIADNKCAVIDVEGLKSYMALNDKRIVTFYLEVSEEIRYHRMLNRGDNLKSVEERIKVDRIVFSKEKIPNVDFFILNENIDPEDVADDIYKKYLYKLSLNK